VTPADKPGSTGQDTEREADRKAGIAIDGATDGQATPVEHEPAAEPEDDQADHGADHEGNGKVDEPTARVATPDDLELSHGTPPPWQRVTNDEAATAAPTPAAPPPADPPAGQQTAQVPPTQPQPDEVEGRPGEKTVSIERPVVTGAAAARLFADGGPPSPATVPPPAMPHAGVAPSRTTVHLEGSPPAGSPYRVNPTATPSALRRPGRGPRRANLQIKRFDPWSVLKLSLVLGVALFFVWLVAVGVLYAVLDGMGVWDKLNGISSEILQPTDEGGGEPLISAGRVFGVAAIIGAVNIVLFSALSTVGAFIYNVSADLAGGLEVTLAERE
jgi:Transmembrane domain of unknown function (DUF3566)